MSTFSAHPRLRWAVPAAVVALLAGAGPIVTSITATARGSLTPRTAAQLLVDVQHAKVAGLSGTVVQTADLGLPSLPSVGGHGGDSASFSSLVSGSHTLRLWYAGPEHVRLALLGQLGESDLVRNGADAWAWSSTDNTATHYSVPSNASASPAQTPTPDSALTPQRAAEAALKAIDPTTRVTTDPTATVAGRPAYQLQLTPRDPRSLVGAVRIAIDGATHVPTRVQVFARGATSPAFEIGFTSFSPSTPPSSVFSFTPPPGATVKQATAPSHGPADLREPKAPAASSPPRVVGSGWTSVVVAPVGSLTSGKAASEKSGSAPSGLTSMLKSLPSVSGPWGSGHLLRGTVFSAVLTDDGQLAIGAVAPELLYSALARR